MSSAKLKTHPTSRRPRQLWTSAVLGWTGVTVLEVTVLTVILAGGCTSGRESITARAIDEPIEREIDAYPELNPPLITAPPLVTEPVVASPRVVRRLDYVITDEARWNDFVRRWDHATDSTEHRVPRVNRARPDLHGTTVIDGNDADGDGYVEYNKNGNYVAELKPHVEGNRALVEANTAVVAETQAHTAHPQEVTVRGQVVELEVSAFRTPPEPQVLAVLEQQDGQRVLVNLGTADIVGPLKIHVGQIISVAAQVGSINGRRALVAHDIVIDGKSITIAPAALSE